MSCFNRQRFGRNRWEKMVRTVVRKPSCLKKAGSRLEGGQAGHHFCLRTILYFKYCIRQLALGIGNAITRTEHVSYGANDLYPRFRLD